MSSQSTHTKDAWSWTVDDLVNNVCRSSALFHAAGCRLEDLANTTTLEAQLRDQEVTGATFLTALDSHTLRSELGIQNPGQRTALLAVIEFLRQQSSGYWQQTTTTGVEALQIRNDPMLAPTHNSEPLGHPATLGSSVRKRQKTAHVTTTPLPVGRQAPTATSAFSATSKAEPSVDSSGQWDHLIHWEHADDRAVGTEDLAADGEAEDEFEVEGEEERSGSGESEVQGPIQTQDQSRISREEIVDIINDQIEHYTNAWKPNHDVIKGDEIDYDPEAMWQEAEVSNQRQSFIQIYKADATYYRHRLDELCDEIMKFPGNTEGKIRHQCRNLEITINSLELSEWLLSIYSLEPVDSSDEEEAVQSLPGHHPRAVQGSLRAVHPTRSVTAPTRKPAKHEIIDLGSLSQSSQSDINSVLIDSSPPPELPSEGCECEPTDRAQTPDSAIADTIEPLTNDTPLHRRPTTCTATSRPLLHLGDEPQNASIASARRWKWSDLIDTRDRKRIVMKALQEMNGEDKETIRGRLKTVGKSETIREVHAYIRMLVRNETKMPGVLPRDMPKIISFTRLFLCWWLCDNYFRAEPSTWDLDQLEQRLHEGLPDLSTFCDYLNIIMATTFNPAALRYPEQPSQAEIIEISSDDEPPPRPTATHPGGRPQRPQASQYSTTIVLD
jgi:hypothetical protein